MPNYGALGTPTALYAGDEVVLWNGETPAVGAASAAVQLAARAGSPAPAAVAISIAFAAQPTDVVAVQVANEDEDANYVTLASVAGSTSSTNLSPDILQLATNAAFLRLVLSSQSAGGAITAKVRRAA